MEMKKQALFHYERHNQPLLPGKFFFLRLVRHAGIGLLLIVFSLGIGILGYHFFEKLSWLDSLLNASMILGGMGPVNIVVTTGGKLFASLYALFSGIIFLAAASVMVAPVIHRIMHQVHLDDEA